MKGKEFPYEQCEDCNYWATLETLRIYGPRVALSVRDEKMACNERECKLENELGGALALSNQNLLNKGRLTNGLKEDRK